MQAKYNTHKNKTKNLWSLYLNHNTHLKNKTSWVVVAAVEFEAILAYKTNKQHHPVPAPQKKHNSLWKPGWPRLSWSTGQKGKRPLSSKPREGKGKKHILHEQLEWQTPHFGHSSFRVHTLNPKSQAAKCYHNQLLTKYKSFGN